MINYKTIIDIKDLRSTDIIKQYVDDNWVEIDVENDGHHATTERLFTDGFNAGFEFALNVIEEYHIMRQIIDDLK